LKYLAIDTSGDLIVIAVNGEKIHTEYLKGCNTKHSVTLMPYVEKSLISCEMQLSDVDFFAVVTGPGSFTGIRIGVATVKALAFALNKPVLSLTSFDVIAYSDNAPVNCVCLINANHGNYYSATYKNKQLQGNAQFLPKQEILQSLSECEIAVNQPIDRHSYFLADVLSGVKNACEQNANNLTSGENVNPLYVKKSQAEEEFCG